MVGGGFATVELGKVVAGKTRKLTSQERMLVELVNKLGSHQEKVPGKKTTNRIVFLWKKLFPTHDSKEIRKILQEEEGRKNLLMIASQRAAVGSLAQLDKTAREQIAASEAAALAAKAPPLAPIKTKEEPREAKPTRVARAEEKPAEKEAPPAKRSRKGVYQAEAREIELAPILTDMHFIDRRVVVDMEDYLKAGETGKFRMEQRKLISAIFDAIDAGVLKDKAGFFKGINKDKIDFDAETPLPKKMVLALHRFVNQEVSKESAEIERLPETGSLEFDEKTLKRVNLWLAMYMGSYQALRNVAQTEKILDSKDMSDAHYIAAKDKLDEAVGLFKKAEKLEKSMRRVRWERAREIYREISALAVEARSEGLLAANKTENQVDTKGMLAADQARKLADEARKRLTDDWTFKRAGVTDTFYHSTLGSGDAEYSEGEQAYARQDWNEAIRAWNLAADTYDRRPDRPIFRYGEEIRVVGRTIMMEPSTRVDMSNFDVEGYYFIQGSRTEGRIYILSPKPGAKRGDVVAYYDVETGIVYETDIDGNQVYDDSSGSPKVLASLGQEPFELGIKRIAKVNKDVREKLFRKKEEGRQVVLFGAKGYSGRYLDRSVKGSFIQYKKK